jgi:F-type H+-transporting ATPase subunit b
MSIAAIFLLPNGTFLVELAVLLIILWLTKRYIVPPLTKAMEERQADIKASLDAAEAAKVDAAAADDQRRQALEDARSQARDIVAQANTTAEQVRSEAQAKGQTEYDRIVGNADAEVTLARQRAVDDAAAQLGTIVMGVVERVIGREVDMKAHQDLVDEAVGALRTSANAGETGAQG